MIIPGSSLAESLENGDVLSKDILQNSLPSQCTSRIYRRLSPQNSAALSPNTHKVPGKEELPPVLFLSDAFRKNSTQGQSPP